MAFTTISTPIGSDFFHAANRLRLDIAKKIAIRRTYVQTKSALSKLDNATLADLGITYSQIESIARETAKSNN